jgi:PKD domain
MAQSRCFTPVRGNAMRVVALDGCGAPVYGEDSVGVSDGFVTISFTANTEEGEEISVTNAAGRTCVREVPCPQFLGYTVEIEFCKVDPAVLAILTGQDVEMDAQGLAAGFRMNSANSGCDRAFALEIWTGTPGERCNPDAPAAASAGGYLLLPFMQGGIFGDFTIENAAISFTVTGAATKTGGLWGVGPFDVILDAEGNPAPLAVPIAPDDHLLVRFTEVAPPDVFCGTMPLLNPADAVLTGVTDTAVDLTVTFEAEPAGTDPWWVDFGDGTWDYSANGADIVHTYATAGTYDWVAYRGASQITGQVVVAMAPVP